MEWTEHKDVMLACEIILCEPPQGGSKECGSAWSQIVNILKLIQASQCHKELLEVVTVSSRKTARKRKREIENRTGISPEDSELD